MNTKESIEAILEGQFQFLTDRGFQILSFEYYEQSFGDWRMTFQSNACFIQVYSDRGDVNIIFKPINIEGEEKRFGISLLVYFVTNEKVFIGDYEGELRDQQGQIEWLAGILEKYLDAILPIMGKDLPKYYEALEKSGKIVFKLHMENSKGTYH